MGIIRVLIVHAATNHGTTNRLDFTKTKYDQSTFVGRYQYFFSICNPIRLLDSKEEILRAQDIVTKYKKGQNFPNFTEDELWQQSTIYDTAIHPVTDKPIPLLGRMAAQAPINTFIIGSMLVFFKTTKEVLFWQWANQSFNAFVNQMNSSTPSADLSESLKSYALAVSLALSSSVAIAKIAGNFGTLVQRLVPFASVCLSHCLNIPLSRQSELRDGITLWYEGEPVAKSKKFAKKAITNVITSRITFVAPHMTLVPLVMTTCEGFFKKNPKLSIPFQLSTTGIMLLFAIPMGCALYPQRTFISVDSVTELEPEVQEQLKKLKKPPKIVYYNKGL